MNLVTFLLYVYSTNAHNVLLLHYSVAAATMFFFLEQMENQDTYTHIHNIPTTTDPIVQYATKV